MSIAITNTTSSLVIQTSAAGAAGSSILMTGGGTAQDYAGFATRAAFVAWAAGKTPAVGAVVEADGMSYRYIGSGTAIGDLPGWILNGEAHLTGAETLTDKTLVSPNITGAPLFSGLTNAGRGQMLADLQLGQVFASRSVATNATTGQTIDADSISVMAASGRKLDFVYDAAGTAMTTGDGRKWRAAQVPTLNHFAAVGDAVTNDRGAFNTAVGIASASFRYVEAPDRYLLTGNTLTLNGAQLKGELVSWDTTNRASWNTRKSSLVIDPAFPISMLNGSGISNLAIIRNGLDASNVDLAAVAAYTGVGVQIKSSGTVLDRMAIFGFTHGVDSDVTNAARTRFYDLNIDCTNGIRLKWDAGGAEFVRVRCEANLSSPPDTVLERTGVGIELGDGTNRVDGPILTDCFTNYKDGFKFVGMNSCKTVDCMSDGPRTTAAGIGMQILGDSTEHSHTNYRVASHRGGVYIDTIRDDLITPCTHYFSNFIAWQNRDYAMNVVKGIVYINGGAIKRSPSSDHDGVNLGQGLVADGAQSIIYVDGVDFSELTDALVAKNGGTIYYGARCRFGANIDNVFVTSSGGQILPLSFEITGDVVKAANSNAATLPTVNANVGAFGSFLELAAFTVNAKGLVTAASEKQVPFRFYKTNMTTKPRFFPMTVTPGSGAASFGAGSLRWYPVFVPAGYQPDTLEWEVTTGIAGNARAGVYAHDLVTNGPGLLIQDSGDVSVAIAGLKTMTLSSPLSADVGLVWVALHTDVAVTVRSGAASGANQLGGTALASSAVGYAQATAYAPLPADASPITAALTGTGALMALYRA